jgi:hypothetical protein
MFRLCQQTRITVVCRAAIFLLIVGQNTLMSAECGRVLVMVPGDRSGKLAAVPLVVSAAAQQPQVVVISVVVAAAVQQPQVVVTRMVI